MDGPDRSESAVSMEEVVSSIRSVAAQSCLACIPS